VEQESHMAARMFLLLLSHPARSPPVELAPSLSRLDESACRLLGRLRDPRAWTLRSLQEPCRAVAVGAYRQTRPMAFRGVAQVRT
jgi:hypothetical protein